MGAFINLMHSLAPQEPEPRLILAAIVVIVAGSRLGDYGDVFAKRLHLGHALVGLILMAFATAMPELVTSVSAAAVQNSPNLCMGNCFGSIFFNISILALLDIVSGAESLFGRVALKMAVAAAASIVVISVFSAAIAIELAAPGAMPRLLGAGLVSWAAAGAYIFGAWIINRTEQDAGIRHFGDEAPDDSAGAADAGADGPSLGLTAAKYAAAVALILWAGLNLSRGGDDLAVKWKLGQSFVGSIFLAVSTSLPEVAATVAMCRRGFYNMAFGNIFGSNAFNIMVLVVSDFAYRRGSLVADALYERPAAAGGEAPGALIPDGSLHLVTIFLALLMTGIAVIGIVVKPKRTKLRLGWPAAAILVLYLVGAYMLYALGA